MTLVAVCGDVQVTFIYIIAGENSLILLRENTRELRRTEEPMPDHFNERVCVRRQNIVNIAIQYCNISTVTIGD